MPLAALEGGGPKEEAAERRLGAARYAELSLRSDFAPSEEEEEAGLYKALRGTEELSQASQALAERFAERKKEAQVAATAAKRKGNDKGKAKAAPKALGKGKGEAKQGGGDSHLGKKHKNFQA